MSDRVFNPEVYSGHDGIRRFLAEVHEVWETFTWEVTEVRESDDVVLALVHSVGRGRGSGLDIDRHSAMLWRIPEETLLAVTFYRDPSAAERAAECGPECRGPEPGCSNSPVTDRAPSVVAATAVAAIKAAAGPGTVPRRHSAAMARKSSASTAGWSRHH
jgi:hypothetical protein